MGGEVKFPGHGRILHVGDQLGCERTALRYSEWQIKRVVERDGKVFAVETPRDARVNGGRWIVDCAYCQMGVATDPDLAVAYCGECGARYEVPFVSFPDDREAIEAALLVRPDRALQNWFPGESAEDLLAENERHGV